MVTNTQISESLVRRKRSGKRPWLILVAAIGLVTLPVLPLKFLGIPGPDFSNVTDLGKAVFKRIKGTIPGKVDSSKEENGQLHEAAFDSADVELLDKTAQTLLRKSQTLLIIASQQARVDFPRTGRESFSGHPFRRSRQTIESEDF
ncbi:MAG: hypothetical protein R3D26_15040 [Cyanobacteriota/Melainabacteria group bacterium]